MNPDELDLKRLKAFRLVARYGTLRQAALRLNQTIPAVSGKLRKLEEELGVTLFERSPNKLVLTPIGHRFLNEADALVARAERAIASLDESAEPTGRLTVAIGSDQSRFFAPRFCKFLNSFPQVQVALSILQASDALQRLRHGELDLAIGVFPRLSAEFEQRTVIETTMSLLCPVGHPLLKQSSPALDEIARYRLILLPRHAETRKFVDRAMTLANVHDSNIIEVANCHTASTFVDLEVGVALVHSICCDSEPTQADRRIDLGKQIGKVGFSLVTRSDVRRDALLATLVEHLIA